MNDIKPEQGLYICEDHNISFTLVEDWSHICTECMDIVENTPDFDAGAFGRCIQGGLPTARGKHLCRPHGEIFTLSEDPTTVCVQCYDTTFRSMLETRELQKQ